MDFSILDFDFCQNHSHSGFSFSTHDKKKRPQDTAHHLCRSSHQLGSFQDHLHGYFFCLFAGLFVCLFVCWVVCLFVFCCLFAFVFCFILFCFVLFCFCFWWENLSKLCIALQYLQLSSHNCHVSFLADSLLYYTSINKMDQLHPENLK